MTNYHSDFSPKPRYDDECYLIDRTAENMFLIEREFCSTIIDTTERPESFSKGVICALGFIILLIFGSTWQLYRSINAVPDRPEVTPSQKNIENNSIEQPKTNKVP